jgi:Flp pilus assembly protein TadD
MHFVKYIFALALLSSSYQSSAQQADAEELLKSAMTEQQQGDFPSAIRDYRAYLKLRPKAVEAKVNLGAALAHVGEFDAAIEQYQAALPLVAQKTPIQMNIGLAYYKKGSYKNAQAQFQAVFTQQPNDVRVAILLADADIHLGDVNEAMSVLTPLAAVNAGNLDFDYVYGSALIKTGKAEEGATLLEKVGAAGNSGDAYMLAGAALLETFDLERTRHDLEEALRLDPKLPGIYSLVGRSRDRTGDAKGAEAAFREALKTSPDDFNANLYLGAILSKRRELAEAKGYLQHALEIMPASSMARYEVAMLNNASGEYQAAADQMKKVIDEEPNWLEPHIAMAALYYKLHQPELGAQERKTVERLTAEQQAPGAQKPTPPIQP